MRDRKSQDDSVKMFYSKHHDRIIDKRHKSIYWLRRYAHEQIYNQFIEHLKPGERVLDAGCGEGLLSVRMAEAGMEVVGIDISEPNIRAARKAAKERNVKVRFEKGDLDNIPFGKGSFDVVVSSHVLEHLPDIERGARELYRVTRKRALIAMPTCLNPACWALLGGDNYWKLSWRSSFAVPTGMLRTIWSLIRSAEGPNEGYGGDKTIPHVWRFPWVMRKILEDVGFHVVKLEAGPLLLPYGGEYLRSFRQLQKRIDRYRAMPVINYLGYGTFAVCTKGD